MKTISGSPKVRRLQKAESLFGRQFGCDRIRGQARQKLYALLATGRAWELKETFSYFWYYKSVLWAGGF